MCSQVVYGETVWWSLLACLRQRYIINSNVQEVKHFFLEMTSAGHTIPIICQHIVYRISYIYVCDKCKKVTAGMSLMNLPCPFLYCPSTY